MLPILRTEVITSRYKKCYTHYGHYAQWLQLAEGRRQRKRSWLTKTGCSVYSFLWLMRITAMVWATAFAYQLNMTVAFSWYENLITDDKKYFKWRLKAIKHISSLYLLRYRLKIRKTTVLVCFSKKEMPSKQPVKRPSFFGAQGWIKWTN